jgi:catechol 2,3-dioxygenase-like lactoylglutathione lyase family enzyme
MTIQGMAHIGMVVEDLPAATEFFVELGLELLGEGQVEGDWAGRIIGLEDVRAEVVMLRTPDGQTEVELSKFLSPPSPEGDSHAPSNAPGIRHICFTVDDLNTAVAGLRERGTELVGEVENYKDTYLLCYVRGPEGIIVELVEEIG